MDYQSLDDVTRAIAACRCSLCTKRTKPVPGDGNPNAAVMLIGEAPGFHEDREGKPFVGAAGAFLEELLKSIGLRRTDVYITNMVHARPPENRDPLPEELAASWPFLKAQVILVKPVLIITLGRISKAAFVPDVGPISAIHGQTFVRSNPATGEDRQWYVVLYHPAAGLHNAELKHVIASDIYTIPLALTSALAERAAHTTK